MAVPTEEATVGKEGAAKGAEGATKGAEPARRGATGRGRPAGRRWRSRLRPWLRWRRLAAVIGSLLGLGAVAVVLTYLLIDLPAANADVSKQATVFLFDDERTELGRVGEFNRIVVPLDRVPPHVRNAVLAAEDRSFYGHAGVSVSGLARAASVNLRGGAVQGGSTITQQYVKNALLINRERTFGRKFREVFIAVKLERHHSKDQILESYLNSIYFGRGAYGVQAAARAYFNKDVRNLTVAEGAVLGGVINSPIASDPSRGGRERLERRWRYVLGGMVQMKVLTAQDAAAQRLPAIAKRKTNAMGGPRGYLIDAVQRELTARGFSDTEIETGGLRIVTSIDRDLQLSVESAVSRLYQRPGIPPGLRVGLIALGPVQAPITAMYGGQDYLRRAFNDATQVPVPAAVPDEFGVPLTDLPRAIDVAATRIGPIPFAGKPLAPAIVDSVRDKTGKVRYEDDGGFHVADGPQARRISLAGRAARAFPFAATRDGGELAAGPSPGSDSISFARISADGRSVAAASQSGSQTFAINLYREADGQQVRVFDGVNLTREDAANLPWEIFSSLP